MKVPFLDLERLHSSIRADLDAAYDRVLASSSFVGKAAMAGFEEAFAAASGLPAAAGCGSGTDALALALRALGVGPGDEVVVPSMTFVATAEAVAHAGAVPVIADVDPATLLLDDVSVEQVRTERTRAVVPVHLYGHVVPFDRLRRWRDGGLLVVEDAAQAHLATWEGQPVGSVGQAACFSFYPGKNLGALGDGGAVLSCDAALVEEVGRLRDHGRRSKYEHDEVGWCSRLDGLQAAFLSAKLPYLASWTASRRRLAARYRERLADRLVPWEQGAVHHLLVARVAGDGRGAVQTGLGDGGVETGIHYPVPLSRQLACGPWRRSCPAAEQAAAEVLSLPMDPLMDEAEVDFVCDLVEAAIRG